MKTGPVKNTRIDILIADNGGKIGENVMMSLRRHGLRTVVLDDKEVRNDKPGYVRNLRNAIRELHPRMILPVFKAQWLAEYKDLLTQEDRSLLIPVCSAQVLDTLDDKVKCSRLVQGLGIPQPKMYGDSQAEEITSWPVVYKRASGLSGSSVYFPKDSKALGNLIRSSSKPHLIMDFIDGYDVSIDAIRWTMSDGSTYFQAVAYRVLWPRQKGISKIRMGVCGEELRDQARRILDAVDYEGVCGLDFRIDRKSGRACFLECNPRFSGGIRSSLAAGLDLPFLMWRLANGETPERLRLHRHRLSIG